jgi:transposase-like protein
MKERGVEVDHSNLNRWVLKYAPALENSFRQYKRPVGDSWRMDETYINVKGKWKYLYRAVSSVRPLTASFNGSQPTLLLPFLIFLA